MDIDAETIAEPDGSLRSLGTIANREEAVRKLVKKLGAAESLRACYEAGPTGYVLSLHDTTGSGVLGDRAEPGAGEGWGPRWA